MKQQKFIIKEEAAYEHEDQYKQFYAHHGTKSFNLRKINANRVYLNSLNDKNSAHANKSSSEKENVDTEQKEAQALLKNSESALQPQPEFQSNRIDLPIKSGGIATAHLRSQ